jgi:hypothetical protein
MKQNTKRKKKTRKKASKPKPKYILVSESRNSYDIMLILRILAYAMVAIIIGVLFYLDILNFSFKFTDKQISHTIFSMLNGLIFGFYLNCLGLLSNKGKALKYITFGVVIVFVALGLGMVAIYLELNFPFLTQTVYESNTEKGILFFFENLGFFSTLFLSSFVAESEI